jgi:phosphoglycerol transferase MdoB-like AlkP superfamily enzyme
VASIPSLVEPFVLSHYANDRLEGLAHHLRKAGYDTAFFHGAPNGSMGFAAFVTMAGFARYFGMTEYGNDADYDGVWGIWDEPFFQFVAKKLTELDEPFLATVFSLSSHEPFHVPPAYEGKLRTSKNPLDQSIHYTDQALEKFFAKAAKEPYFARTLFVMTADHASRTSHRVYKNMVGRFRVPLILHAPGNPQLVGSDESVAQQIDIMPTVLRYVGVKEPFVAFGNDLLAKDGRRFAVSYRDGTFQLLSGDFALHHDGEKTIGLYAYKTDRRLRKNLAGKHPEAQAPLEELLKGILQQYTSRMIDDRLTVSVGR